MNDEARRAYNSYMREYRKRNKERLNEQQKQRRLADPERYRRYQETYWERKAQEQL